MDSICEIKFTSQYDMSSQIITFFILVLRFKKCMLKLFCWYVRVFNLSLSCLLVYKVVIR